MLSHFIIFTSELDSLFSIGVNFNPYYPNSRNYTSLGFAFDIGASWHNSTNLFSAGMVIKKCGYQVY